jgi:hypothetical protein
MWKPGAHFLNFNKIEQFLNLVGVKTIGRRIAVTHIKTPGPEVPLC